jgi:hypothetical protein
VCSLYNLTPTFTKSITFILVNNVADDDDGTLSTLFYAEFSFSMSGVNV